MFGVVAVVFYAMWLFVSSCSLSVHDCLPLCHNYVCCRVVWSCCELFHTSVIVSSVFVLGVDSVVSVLNCFLIRIVIVVICVFLFFAVDVD